MKRKILKITAVVLPVICIICWAAFAVSAKAAGISIDLGSGKNATSQNLQLLLLLTVLSVAPSIILMMTSFTRIVIVMSFVRTGLGLTQTPPNQVLIGLSLFLSLFIMSPVISQVNQDAYQPFTKGEITQEVAYERAMKPIRTFMLKQVTGGDEKEIKLFLNLAGNDEKIESYDDVPTHVLIPAFVLSELKKAFIMGFLILIPFLIIDMVVASTLMSMGMIMVPPSMISLPFKLILFVVVDGWSLIVKTLVTSFTV